MSPFIASSKRHLYDCAEVVFKQYYRHTPPVMHQRYSVMTSAAQLLTAFLSFLYWLSTKTNEQCWILVLQRADRSVRFHACSKKNRAVLYSVSAWSLAPHPNPVASTSSLLEPTILLWPYVSSHASIHEQLRVLGRSGSLMEKQLVTCCPSARMLPYLIIKTSEKQEELEGEEGRDSAVHFKGFVQSGPVAYESAGWEKLK